MIECLLWLVLVSPAPPRAPAREAPKVQWYEDKPDPCAGLEMGDWVRCQPRVVNLGAFDVDLIDKSTQWQTSPTLDKPEPFGKFPTEQPRAKE